MCIHGIYAKPVCMKKILENCNAETENSLALTRCTYLYISVILTDNSNKTDTIQSIQSLYIQSINIGQVTMTGPRKQCNTQKNSPSLKLLTDHLNLMTFHGL